MEIEVGTNLKVIFPVNFVKKTFRNKNSYYNHVNKHKGKTTCPICTKTLSTMSYLKAHMAQIHQQWCDHERLIEIKCNVHYFINKTFYMHWINKCFCFFNVVDFLFLCDPAIIFQVNLILKNMSAKTAANCKKTKVSSVFFATKSPFMWEIWNSTLRFIIIIDPINVKFVWKISRLKIV